MAFRTYLTVILVAFFAAIPVVASQPETSAGSGWAAIQSGSIVLFRHANAPGGGDPSGLRLGDCSTQRNLDAAGRDQARRIGASFRQRGIVVNRVLTSQWCRSEETARLAFGETVNVEPAFNSFFGNRDQAAAQTAAATSILVQWKKAGVLVVVTHQVNITALTGIIPASGEGVVVRMLDDKVSVLGRILP